MLFEQQHKNENRGERVESRVETAYPENSKKQKAKTNGTFRIQAAFYECYRSCAFLERQRERPE